MIIVYDVFRFSRVLHSAHIFIFGDAPNPENHLAFRFGDAMKEHTPLIEFSTTGFTCLAKGAAAFSHSNGMPFACAVKAEVSFKANHGSVSEKAQVEAEIPLISFERFSKGIVLRGRNAQGEASMRVQTHDFQYGTEVRLAASGSYAWRLRLPACNAAFGCGERFRTVNLAGQTIRNLVTEHIQLRTLLERAALPERMSRLRAQEEIGTYAPVPMYVSDAGVLTLIDIDGPATLEFRSDATLVTCANAPRRLVFLKAGGFEELGRALKWTLGNNQYLPDWCHDGMIVAVQGGSKRVREMVERMQEAGVALAGVWCQDWCGCHRTAAGYQVNWNWLPDDELYPDLAGLIKWLHGRGVRFMGYINPYLVEGGPLYNHCRDQGFLITRTDGSVYHVKSTTFNAGMLDLTNPAVCDFVRVDLIENVLIGLGMDGWMADFGEYLPFDCVLHDGDPIQLHNRWPLMWAKLNRQVVDASGNPDLFFFSRSGYLGIQNYAPILWNGDQHTSFSVDYGMPSVLPATFSLGFSGVTLTHFEAGGFFSMLRLRRTPELLIRWMEMCALSPLMRSHESIRPKRNIQPYDPEILPHTVRLSRLHAALAPYLRHVVEEATQGVAAMRPDFFASSDFGQHRDEYVYTLGADLFVAPVVTPGATSRTVYLPEGAWIHLVTGETYEGPTRIEIRALLGRPTAFYRADSVFASTFRDASKVFHE